MGTSADREVFLLQLRAVLTGIMASSGITVTGIEEDKKCDNHVVFTMSNGERVTAEVSENEQYYLLRTLPSGQTLEIPKTALGMPN